MIRKLNYSSKSQATIEFLTTYAWFFIIIIIVISALAYFGILSPSKLLPKRCSMGPEIACLSFIIGQTDAGTGVLRLRLRNNIPEPIVVESWGVSSDAKTSFSCLQNPVAGTWLSGEIMDVEFTGCNNLESGLLLGDRGKVNVKMSYYLASTSSTFSNNVEGEVFTTVTNVQGLLTQPQCSDSTDNDRNGCIDYSGGDTGCSSASDTSETGGACPQNGGGGLELYCFVSTVCSTTIVFGMSALNDALAETPGSANYDYKACCRATNDTLSNSCASPDFVAFHLSGSTAAHVEENAQPNYNVDVCLSGTSSTVSCDYTTSSCLADETCLATYSAVTDAHVGDCETQPFANKICCKLV
ncbi:hypothetical protein HYX05_04065 [Candidatus Woesearchaeota archaeon]|nr:hypothetical protein [Candidatus Woesearchaeota archaeon]